MKTLFFLLITLFFATIGFAEVSHQSEATNKKIEKIEEKLDTTKEELTKYTQITEDTKERVGDISGSVDRFGVLVGLFGILMTVMIIYFSFRSTKEAKLEAKEEAQKLLKEWIEKEAKSVFEAKVNALSDELQAKGDEILKRIEEKANEQHQRHEEDHQRSMLNPNATQEEKDKVTEEVKQIEGKKEEDLTFDDYFIKISNKYNKKEYKEALHLIDKAMKLASNNDEQIAGLLLTKGEVLKQLGELDEAIKDCDTVISIYQKSTVDMITEFVALAILQKGLILARQDKFEEALQTYNKLISTYKDSHIEGIIEHVKNAIQNKLEVEIIINKAISNDDILMEKLIQVPKDRAPIDMLLILQNAKISPQDTELQSWLEKYKEVKYSTWGFNELEGWIEKASYNEDVKRRIQSYIEIFKTHLHRT